MAVSGRIARLSRVAGLGCSAPVAAAPVAAAPVAAALVAAVLFGTAAAAVGQSPPLVSGEPYAQIAEPDPRFLPAPVRSPPAEPTSGRAPAPLLIDTGHVGTVTDLRYDDARRLLFSVGEDGALRVWSHDQRGLVGYARLGMDPVERLALHPERPLLAAVLRTAGGAKSIGVWDWSSGRRLFARLLEEAPLHFGFTSRGSSLVYTRAQFDSVVFLDPRTGAVQSRALQPFGIVSFVTTSTNERTIMTYQPTGRIRYWNAATGRLTAEVSTVPELDRITISHDKAVMVARHGAEIVVVDVITGAVRGRVQAPDALGFAVSDRNPELTLLRPGPLDSGGGVIAHRLQLRHGLRERVSSQISLEGAVTAAAYGTRSVFIADQAGIAELHQMGGVSRVLANELLEGMQLAVLETGGDGGGVVLVATPAQLVLAPVALGLAAGGPGGSGDARSLMRPPPDRSLLKRLTLQRMRNPFQVPVGVAVVPARAAGQSGSARRALFLVWPREGDAGVLATLDPGNGALRYRLTGLEAPLLQVSVIDDDRLLLLDRAGSIWLYPLRAVLTAGPHAAVPPLQRFWAPGARTVVGVGAENRLIAARGASDSTTPLLHVDTITEETLPLSIDALLVYDLALLDNGRLFSLGMDAGGTRTVLQQHFGRHALFSRDLDSYRGEDLFATLAVAPDRRQVYSSLGVDTVRVWDGRRLLDLERSGHRPRQLTATDTLLLAVNADGTVTVWDRTSRRVLFNLYLFQDYEWLAVTPQGRLVHSRHAGERYRVTPWL